MTSSVPGERTENRARVDWRFLAAWLLCGLMLVGHLDAVPLTRTQEARVLETAREMVGAPVADWLVPRTNGHARLRKPPLAYWLAAGAMTLFGPEKWAGRLPFAVASWLALGLTFDVTRRMFNARAGFFAATTLLGAFLFVRFGRLAETDALAMLFVTAAVYAVWRGWESTGRWTAAAWFHASAASIALAILSKGPPGAYPLIFFVTLSVVERRWGPLRWWARCGAPVTIVIIAVPWFVYAARHPAAAEVADDLLNSAAGGAGHARWFIVYVPMLMLALLPWTPIAALALARAFQRRGQVRSLRASLVWSATILLPLCAWGNKQEHYLLTAMPPLMVLVGYALDEAVARPDDTMGRSVRHILLGLLVLGAVGASCLPAVGWSWRGRASGADVAALAAAVAVVVTVGALWQRRGFRSAARSCCTGGAALVVLFIGWWAPTLHATTTEQVADQIKRKFGAGPYVFRRAESLPLVFAMKQVIPVVQDDELLPLRTTGATLVLEVAHRGRVLPVPNPRWHEVFHAEADEKLYVVYAVVPPVAQARAAVVRHRPG